MSHEKEQGIVDRVWLIRKDGYFYRPNCCGYTASKFEAGRYTKAEAEREAAVEPWHMQAIHEDDWQDDAPSASVRDLKAHIEALTAEIASLKAERDRARADALDAARYRWLREQHWYEDLIAVVVQPKQAIKLGYDCPNGERLDGIIDAAVAALSERKQP